MATGSSLRMAANELVAHIESDPHAAVKTSDDIISAARLENDLGALAVGLRARGVGLRLTGQIHDSLVALDEAVEVASELHDTVLIGEVRTSRAGALLALGRLNEAFADVNGAISSLDGLPLAFGLTQRAAILGRMRQPDEAITDFGRAIDILQPISTTPTKGRSIDRENARRYEALARMNRGLLQAYRGEFDAAVTDLIRVRDICEEGRERSDRLEFLAASAVHNLGFVETCRGSLLAALAHYRSALDRYHVLGLPTGVLLRDQSEVLIALGLALPAISMADDAITKLTEIDDQPELAEALLTSALALEFGGEIDAALARCSTAREMFAQQGRDGWTYAAELAALRMRTSHHADPEYAQHALDLAATLAAAGHLHHARQARLLAGTHLIHIGRPNDALTLLTSAPVPDDSPVELRLEQLSVLATAHSQLDASNEVAATVDAALRLFRRHQDSFGALEVRANLGRHIDQLHALALRDAWRSGDVRRLIDVAMAVRSGSLRTPPGARDARTDASLDRLRAITAQARTCEPERLEALQHERAALQEQIAGAARAADTATHVDVTLFSLSPRPVARGADLISFVDVDGRLIMVRLIEGDDPQTHLDSRDVCATSWLGAAARAAVQAMNRLARADTPTESRAALGHFLAEHARTVDAVVFGDGMAAGELMVISPPAGLCALPWALLPSLHARPFIIAPTFRRDAVAGFASDRAVIVGGPALRTVDAEVASVRACWPSCRVLMGSDATSSTVLAAIAGADVAHIAAHYTPSTDNPLFSTIEVADGPLFVHELVGLGSPPRTVVLGACSGAHASPTGRDDQLGLATGLLAVGVETVICATTLLPDNRDTVEFLSSIHRALAAGANAASALAAARLEAVRGGGAPSLASSAMIAVELM